MTASAQRTAAAREARLRCNCNIAPAQRSDRLRSSRDQSRHGVLNDWYTRAVKSPLRTVYDFIWSEQSYSGQIESKTVTLEKHGDPA